MAQDLLETISALQNTAIGNSRKRIEDAAAKTKKNAFAYLGVFRG